MKIKVNKDCVPHCPHGHMMMQVRTHYGPHSAKLWACASPGCVNYAIAIVVPMEEIECEVVGMCVTDEHGNINF